MTREQIIELLSSAGVNAQEAERRADEHVEHEATVADLTKSMSALEEINQLQTAAEEAAAARVEAARAEGELNLAAALADGLDALNAEMSAQNAALSKGLMGVLNLVERLTKSIKRLEERPAVEATKPAAPLAKSVDYIPAPHETPAAAPARDELLKSLAQMAPSNPDEAARLFSAAALLESGADPLSVKNRFSL